MKTAPLLTLVSSLFFASVCAATDSHDADRAIEASLKATVNDKHVHFHVKHGIVTVDGKGMVKSGCINSTGSATGD